MRESGRGVGFQIKQHATLDKPVRPSAAVDGDFLACGSETGDVYVYYKALSKPVAAQAFAAGEDAFGGVAGSAAAHADRAFISAVCWRPTAHTLLAASSQGVVKVYQLTGSGQAH